MAGRYLLDTNIAIAFLNGDAAVCEKVRAERGVTLCSVVASEMLYGAVRSRRAPENLTRCRSLFDAFGVLPLTRETAERAAQVKDRLRAAGRPIPENDVWVAAVALEHDLTLVSRDEHFEPVAGLTLLHW